MSAKFLQFKPIGRIPTIFCCGVSRYTSRPFVGVRTTFRAFQRDDDTYTFCHGLWES